MFTSPPTTTELTLIGAALHELSWRWLASESGEVAPSTFDLIVRSDTGLSTAQLAEALVQLNTQLSTGEKRVTFATDRVTQKRGVHPGEILFEEYMLPLKLNVEKLAAALGTDAWSVSETVNQRRDMTIELAIRLARYFDSSAESWMALQSAYDVAKRSDFIRHVQETVQRRSASEE